MLRPFLYNPVSHRMQLTIPTWLSAILFLLSLYLLPFTINASPSPAYPNISGALLSKLESKLLWTRQEWLNLIHYKGTPDNYLSPVDDLAFFNAANGKTSPKQEFLASINAFYTTEAAETNSHPQCRFIARLKWLKKQLPESLTELPQINCSEYIEWRKQVPGHKVSLIFPAYHLNSPSSMFGHTLLRLDPPDTEKTSTWLSMAVNFGANIQNSDNSLLFAFKGLAGGYSGTFIVNPYYTKIQEYNREENRDIWEYPLNLTPQETEQMVEHLWELKNINFDYYFFDENCSYRLLELLEVARPGINLTGQYGLTAIPVDTVRSIDQAKLITDIQYRPSQATSINYLLKQLDSKQKKLVLMLSSDATLINSDEFKQASKKKQDIMLDAAYRYLRFQQNDNGHSDLNAKNSFLLLNAINKTDNFEAINVAFSDSQRPEKGHLSKRFDIMPGSRDLNFENNANNTQQNYLQMQFRMSFHSLEDNIKGFLEGAQINIGSIAVRAYEDKVQLQQFDLIDIFSITPRNQFFQPLSWRVYTGLEQQLINGRDHLTGHVTGGAGVSYQPWEHGYIYSMFTARLESNSQFSRKIEPAVGLTAGLLQHFSIGTAHLTLTGEEFLNNEYRHRIEFTQNIPFARNHAFKFKLKYQQQIDVDFTDAQLSYHYYFH